MGIVIFIIVLLVLVVVHELGHFFAAKITGMKVEEFGVGYPPRLWGKKFGQTLYSINWLPLGGFVKIKGEDGDVTATDQSQEVNGNAFTDKNHFAQLFVLVAGVVMNMVLAYVLLSTVLMMGIPRALYGEDIAKAESTQLVVAGVLPGSPAESAGLLQGDIITKAFAGDAEFSSVKVEDFITFINATESGEPVALSLSRNDEAVMISAIPAEGVIESDVNKKALGVSLATVGVVKLSFIDALVEGFRYTTSLTQMVFVGLIEFFASIFTFSADLSQVAGPVGIAGTVGDAQEQGATSLLFIAALISINLAIINLLPFPALDGGRIVFVLYEMISRRKVSGNVAMLANGVGFVLLIALMVVVTISDIGKLF